jgi:single-stranded DNA-binding protein
LVEDAKTETMPNGVLYVTITLACNEDKRVDGIWQKRVQYVPVAIYGNYAQSLLPALKKSQRAIVLGKIECNAGKFIIVAMKVRVTSGSRDLKDDDKI